MACLVRYVATSGNDSGTGCDASAPLLTIGGCISRLAPPAPPSWPPRYAAGGTCLVSPGTYHEGPDAGSDDTWGAALVNSVNDLTIALAPQSAWPAGTTATEVARIATVVARTATDLETATEGSVTATVVARTGTDLETVTASVTATFGTVAATPTSSHASGHARLRATTPSSSACLGSRRW